MLLFLLLFINLNFYILLLVVIIALHSSTIMLLYHQSHQLWQPNVMPLHSGFNANGAP